MVERTQADANFLSHRRNGHSLDMHSRPARRPRLRGVVSPSRRARTRLGGAHEHARYERSPQLDLALHVGPGYAISGSVAARDERWRRSQRELAVRPTGACAQKLPIYCGDWALCFSVRCYGELATSQAEKCVRLAPARDAGALV